MRKFILLLSCLFIFLPSVYAAENIGLCSDYFARGVFQIVPRVRYAARAQQTLIRGQFLVFHETGMERVGWAVVEVEYLSKKVYKNRSLALHALSEGDRIYILNPERTEILYQGYYQETWVHGRYGSTNKPQLFADTAFKNILLSYDKFVPFFAEPASYPIVVIQEKNPALQSLDREALQEIRDYLYKNPGNSTDKN